MGDGYTVGRIEQLTNNPLGHVLAPKPAAETWHIEHTITLSASTGGECGECGETPPDHGENCREGMRAEIARLRAGLEELAEGQCGSAYGNGCNGACETFAGKVLRGEWQPTGQEVRP